jgi:hypothetical protein
MISSKDLIILIIFIILTIILRTIGLTNGIKKRDWFNIILGSLRLLISLYLIWGLFMIINII